MRSLSKTLLLLLTMVNPLVAQERVDWQAMEAAVYQAIVQVDVDAFAAKLDPSYTGVYDRGIVDREAQIAAVAGDWETFELSQFTARPIDSETVLVTYRVTTQGRNAGTFWASTLWRLSGGQWRMVLHTATPAT